MPEEPRVVAPTKALLERADAREAALRALVDAESSAQRREHIAALQREFEQLSNLPSHKAFGWAQRRENHSAARLQSAWRRRSATRAFKRTVRAALASRREQAAAAIQRAQRTKHRTVFETAPPVSQEMVAEMSRAVMTLTLERAHELKEARKAIAKAKEADPGATRLPPLPAWWVQSGSVPRETIAAALNDWPAERGVLQATAVRRQVMRTHAAAQHCSPSGRRRCAAVAIGAAGADELHAFAAPTAPMRPAAREAHARMLQHARHALEAAPRRPRPLRRRSTRAQGRAGAKKPRRASENCQAPSPLAPEPRAAAGRRRVEAGKFHQRIEFTA